jgi:hypothetical protein
MEEDDFINNTVKPRKAPKSEKARQLEIRQMINRGRRTLAQLRATVTVPQEPPVSQVDISNQEAAALEAEETAMLKDELRVVQADLQQEMEAHGIKRKMYPVNHQVSICKAASSKMHRLNNNGDEPLQQQQQQPKAKRHITPTLVSASVSGKSEKEKKKKGKGKAE